jgi:Kef-type K+ transport system membrane component KefB
MIIGAFSAGLILNRTRQRGEIERATTTIGLFLVPVFFASVGAAVKLSAFSEPATLAAGALLIVAGVIGKFAAGYAPIHSRETSG